MKKLGLCVNYNCDNYGSMLQIFATQKILNQYNCDYEIIRYNKKTIGFMLKNIFRIFNVNFVHDKFIRIKRKYRISQNHEVKLLDNQRRFLFQKYRKEYIGPYSNIFKGYSNLCSAATKYDVVMVGSDQLWLPAGLGSNFYNLLFVPDNIRKVSFSTSFGVSSIPGYQRKKTKKYLDRINYLSVREKKGQDIVKELTGRKVKVVLDPTLLIKKEEWDVYFTPQKVIDGRYIFAYFLGNNIESRRIVEEFAKQAGLEVITCPHLDQYIPEDESFGDKKLFNVTPVDFLNLIRNAEYVCTDSFHGTVFSILNSKKFISFPRFATKTSLSTNNRIDSLLDFLQLEKQKWIPNMDVRETLERKIDYEIAYDKLEELRKESFQFLKEALV